MAPKTRKISTLIEAQLPGFITTEYENFSKFVEKYYEHLESSGQPLDIISNLPKYRDIDYYEKNLLQQTTALTSSIAADSNTITVEDATSFPEENGYIKIGEEICFYQSRTDTQFLEVSRGVSGNTTLGDLYTESAFVTTQAEPHYTNDLVYNISNLFLYALVKNFEDQYLGSFPEKYLKQNIDKRTLIKNIGSFYKAKGTDQSIKFLFNTIISQDKSDVPELYRPKDYTLKSSTSDWIQNYSLKVKVTSGVASNLVGQIITQTLDNYDKEITFASAVVDNVIFLGTDGTDDIYELILEPSTINGEFRAAGRTKTSAVVSSSLSTGDRINVRSTMGFPKQGKLLIGDEVITYNDKTVTQFIIDQRLGPIRNHASDKSVYTYSTISGNGVRLITLGILYNLTPLNPSPYSLPEEKIQESDAGFESLHPVVFDRRTGGVRWDINPNPALNTSSIKGVVNDLPADVSAIFEDDQYFYICSSSYPSKNILVDTEYDVNLLDQKHLKLIRKQPVTTTEVYPTTNRDVGIFVDGVPALGYKDTDFIKFGKIESTTLTNRGTGYLSAPFVLINEAPGKARCFLNGDTVGEIEILTDEVYSQDPTIRITSGENAVLRPVVTNGAITSLDIINAGRYYSSPPIIRIVDSLGKGNFAEYEAILNSDGSIGETRRISGGRFYTRGFVTVSVEAVGRNAAANADIKRWVFNRFYRYRNNLDSYYGTVFPNFNPTKDYGYAYLAPDPSITSNRSTHSSIIGFAYDGNPIYGPFGHSSPTNPNSPIVRLSSGYQLRGSRPNGPDTGRYPLGSFIDDYKWVPSVNSGKTELDSNNGRFCVTPDYPNGVYAYFASTNSQGIPTFPYLLGQNYYSLPVDSNYNSNISQDDIPVGIKSIRTSNSENNGVDFSALTQDVRSGNITSAYVESSTNNFSPRNTVHINNNFTGGFGAVAEVREVTGQDVVSIESEATKASKISIQESAYLFAGDRLIQPQGDGSDATGFLIGDVINSGEFVLRNVIGTFQPNLPIDSETLVVRLVLNSDASFTEGATLLLTNDDDDVLARGVILETVTRQNSVKVRVDTWNSDPDAEDDGNFRINNNYYLRSSNLRDTNRAIIISVNSLSTDLTPFSINNSIAIVRTSEPHNLGTGDTVVVDVLPNDSITETTYYVRKRLYQDAIALKPVHRSVLQDKGIGSFDVLNSGDDYTSGTYQDVELVFQDSRLTRDDIIPAKATVIIANRSGDSRGAASSIIITDKGSGYRRGDILTIPDTALARDVNSDNTQRIVIEVSHVGVSTQNTVLKLSNINNVSQEDYLHLGQEIVQVQSVDVPDRTVTVTRGQLGTTPLNHFDGAEVSLKDGSYRFTENFRPFGDGVTKPYLISYDETTQKISVSYDYSVQNPQVLSVSSSFFDASIPQKLVQFRSAEEEVFKLEFAKGSPQNFNTNPVIDIQKYYKYKFDVSHPSMVDTYLDFSASSNYNIFTEEKEVSGISPGSNGSFVSIKLGFGPAISTNTFQERRSINFQNYFYFIKVSPDVDTGGSYLRIVNDPLAGNKNVIFTTQDRFVYNLDNVPEYDGTGVMSYTTTSRQAVGSIVSVNIVNTGENYNLIPIVYGVSPTFENEASVDPVWDPVTGEVVGFEILDQGSGYSNPVIVVVDGDGEGYQYECSSLNGNLTQVKIIKRGTPFSYKPTVKVAESDVKIYFESNNIGTPQNVRITNNGKGFNSDKSQLSKYTTPYTLVLRNISDKFFSGERIIQNSTGATAVVSNGGWRPGSNLLKVEKVTGVFESGSEIRSFSGNRTATLYSQYYTEFTPQIKSYVDNFGYYTSDKGRLSSSNQRLPDSNFYNDYSYVIRSKTPIDVWRDLIKATTHPAGFQMFGELVIESSGRSEMPSDQVSIVSVTTIELPPVQIINLSSRRFITTTVQKLEDLKIEDGVGSVSVDTFDTSETQTFRVALTPEFNGDFDPNTGQLIGETVFYMINEDSGNPLSLTKSEQLFVTLDGVFQEPGVSYTISGSIITFAAPPFGRRTVEGQETDPVKFYGRALKFKNQSLNDRYFKKIRSIGDQFDGVQFEFNLFFEDGSIVKTDSTENLIVALNGVVQKSRKDELRPFGNSYSIIRSEDPLITDKIRFSKPPIDNEDAYQAAEEIPESLKNYEKCFIYTVGSYERLTINDQLYEYRDGGPYLLLDEVSNTVRKIDEPKYALVFIDGVLQREGDSYQIVGPNITFTQPLKFYKDETGEQVSQDVNIILLYGRDVPKTITFYDFEQYTFNNSIELTVTGSGISTAFALIYNSNSQQDGYLKQGDVSLGRVLSYSRISDDEVKIILQNPKNVEITNEPLEYVNTEDFTFTPTSVVVPDGYIYDWYAQYDENGDLVVGNNAYFSAPDEYPDIVVRSANTLTISVNTGADPFYILSSKQLEDTDTYNYRVFADSIVPQANNAFEVFDDGNTSLGINPPITVQQGDIITFTLDIDVVDPQTSNQIYLFYVIGGDAPTAPFGADEVSREVPYTLTGTRFNGEYEIDTTELDPGSYWYVNAAYPEQYGEIIVQPYTGAYGINANDVQGTITSNPTNSGVIVWNIGLNDYSQYYYTTGDRTKIGKLTVLIGGTVTQTINIASPKVYPIPGTYDITYQFKTFEGERILERNVPNWLYGLEEGIRAWSNRNSMIGNLLPGDQIKIDGESDYRTITSIPRFAFTKSYNNGDYVQNSMYAKAGTTNYEGGTDGVGLSVTANVNQYGEITTLSVSDIEFNKRDLQLFFDEGILLQPTAYGYFTTPVVHFIPVDGNGGGAKAEVIAYGGQILDVVLTDGGSGYTQPPKVVVARRYKRIKQSNRKIDSLSILNIQTDIASSFEMVAYSVVRIEGGPFSPQAISSIITFGGFDPELNTDRDIITTVNTLAGEERQVRMTDRKFPTEARVQSPTVELQYVQPFVEPYITTITGGIIGTESIVTLQSAAREITKIVQIKANKAFRQEKADSINGVGTFLDAPMDLDDTIAYVGNATGFPDTPSRLRIGREVVYYKNRESDRFLNLTRGYEGSPIENHAPGELVLHYPEFLTLLSGGIETILSEGSVAQSSITSIEHTTTFESFSEVKSNDTRNIELTNQVSIEHINTVQDVIEEIIIIPRDSYNIVTEIHTTVSQVRKATAGVNDVDGFVVIADVRNSEVTELLLTQENQIEIDNTNVITYLSIADVSATASVSTQIVTSNYESTVITVQNQIQEITTLLAYTSEIINDVQSNIYSASNITSVKINTVDAYVSSKVNISSSSEDLLKPIYLQTEVTATVADINTFATTVAMIIGTFGAGSSSSTERDYRSAVVDYIIEDYVLEPTIKQRGGFVVILDDPYNEVIYRDGSTFFVENNNQKSPPGFEDYTLGNVGLTLGSFESNALVATGVNSGLTIYDIDFLYPTLVIRDFDTRSQSAFTSTGDVFNLAIPSYQTPVAISTSSGTIGGPITVQTTEYFNNSGYLITSGGTVISYTSKTSNTFEGCTLVNGPDLISPNDELIPFTIV